MSEPFINEHTGRTQRVPLADRAGRVANAGGRAGRAHAGLWRVRRD